MLEAGESAEDSDTWFRMATMKDHVRENKRIHHAMFKGRKAITAPESPSNTWKAEISGRLLSIADSICDHAEQRINEIKTEQEKNNFSTSKTRFMGIAHSKVSNLREFPHAETNVIFEPVDDDDAHANLVFFDKEPSDFFPEGKDLTLINSLIEQLTFTPADKIQEAFGL